MKVFSLVFLVFIVFSSRGQADSQNFAKKYWYTDYHYDADSLLGLDEATKAELVQSLNPTSNRWLDAYNLAYLQTDTASMSHLFYQRLQHEGQENERLKIWNLHAERTLYLGDFQHSYFLLEKALSDFKSQKQTDAYSVLLFNFLKLNIKLSEVEVGLMDSLWKDIEERIQHGIGNPVLNNESYIAIKIETFNKEKLLDLIPNRRLYAEFYADHYMSDQQLNAKQTLASELEYLTDIDPTDYLIAFKLYIYFIERHWTELTSNPKELERVISLAKTVASYTNDWEINEHLYNDLTILKRLNSTDSVLSKILNAPHSHRSDPLVKLIDRGELQRALLKQEKDYTTRLIRSRNYLVTALIVGLLLLVLIAYLYQKMRHAKKKSDGQLKHISTINAILAHDIKAPLVAAFENMKPSIVDESAIESIRTKLWTIKMMMDDLLLWSYRMKNEDFNFKSQIDLIETLEDCIAYAIPISHLKHIVVNREYKSDKELFVNTNKSAVEVVIRNLLYNAMAHSPDNNEVRISILQKLTSIQLIIENKIGSEYTSTSSGIGLKLIEGLNKNDLLFEITTHSNSESFLATLRFIL